MNLLNFILIGTLSFRSISTTTVIPDESDYSIVYNCFYDHSWLMDKSHHCHIVAYGGDKPEFTSREIKLRSMFQQMLMHDRADRQLVKHCFLYHQFDYSYQPCRGISWNRPRKPNLRQSRLIRLWRMAQRDKRREISRARFFEGHDTALVLQCLFTTEWLSNPTHRCHEVAYGGGRRRAQFTDHDMKLQQMYQEEWLRNKVADCFYHHRDDKLAKCYDITWSTTSDSTPQQNGEVKRIWNKLRKENS